MQNYSDEENVLLFESQCILLQKVYTFLTLAMSVRVNTVTGQTLSGWVMHTT